MSLSASVRRHASTVAASAKDKFRVLVVGGGTAGLSVSNQIFNKFKDEGVSLNPGDVAVLDAAQFHHYQPGWTLVGAGLKDKTSLRRPLASLIPKHIIHIQDSAASFEPSKNTLTTTSGQTLSYDILVVAAGLQTNWNAIKGLPEALADPNSGVSSIYSYETCDKIWRDIDALRNGKAVFTQPAGIIKCAGAPQKIMWMAWDRYRTTSRHDTTSVEFYTATPTMFAVKKYSDVLDALRKSRNIPAHFQHNLISIDVSNRIATFKNLAHKPGDAASGPETVSAEYSILHATPPMGALPAIAGSPLADAAGWVSVDEGTLQHKNKEYANVFALGDCSSAPTSKTAAAVTAQTPVVAENVFQFVKHGELREAARYDGYTSCPLLTGYGQLLLAEFKYGLVPKESFAELIGDQATPRRLFYHLKKDLFPWAYYNYMVKGRWYGPHGLKRPDLALSSA